MGVDISIEREDFKDGEWVWVSSESLNDNYDLYALLAGEKNRERRIKPISQARGLPKNLSQGLKLNPDFNDEPLGEPNEYYTWVTLKEILEYPYYDEPVSLYKDGTTLRHIISSPYKWFPYSLLRHGTDFNSKHCDKFGECRLLETCREDCTKDVFLLLGVNPEYIRFILSIN